MRLPQVMPFFFLSLSPSRFHHDVPALSYVILLKKELKKLKKKNDKRIIKSNKNIIQSSIVIKCTVGLDQNHGEAIRTFNVLVVIVKHMTMSCNRIHD